MAGDNFAEQVVASLPQLRTFASKLAGTTSAVDDLVQETVLRALLHVDQFRPGSNLVGWLIVILRNCYFVQWRTLRRFECVDPERDCAAIHPPQEWHITLGEVGRQFAKLPAEYKEALVLVAVNGESYSQAARVTGCALGTIKSRVSRARSELITRSELIESASSTTKEHRSPKHPLNFANKHNVR
jgi:RNA polymerase sigma-70 factor (ECF subfamily)